LEYNVFNSFLFFGDPKSSKEEACNSFVTGTPGVFSS
jgi:hypothetical protein